MHAGAQDGVRFLPLRRVLEAFGEGGLHDLPF
jgi:hypothetical protein